MKKFVVLLLIYWMAGLACAKLELGLNGETVDTAKAPVTISVIAEDQLTGIGCFLGLKGGVADSSNAVNLWREDDLFFMVDDPDILAALEADELYYFEFIGPMEPYIMNGKVFDGIYVEEALGEVLVTLFDGGSGEVIDTATIIPEPMTFGLLGIGVLFIRRR